MPRYEVLVATRVLTKVSSIVYFTSLLVISRRNVMFVGHFRVKSLKRSTEIIKCATKGPFVKFKISILRAAHMWFSLRVIRLVRLNNELKTVWVV